MAHLHVHTIPDGTETSAAIIDPDNEDLHWHTVDGERTSTDAFGAGHTHTIDGETTSPPIDRDSNKGDEMTNQEIKYIGGKVIEVKQIERNGVKVGIVKGYIATWDIDRGSFGFRDRFVPGAFAESILEHQEKGRQIRFKDHHGRTIGGFPAATVREDDIGLFGEGEINLEVQQGREAFSLAKQGVLTDFSVGFTSLADTETTIDGDRVRSISKAILWEGSIVDEPMNPAARITEVKTVVPFQDLPLAPRDRPWDSAAAIARVREFTDSTDEPSAAYRNAFTWFDSANADDFGAYKLPLADVIDGRLMAVPRGILAAAAALQGARGGVDIPDADRPRVIRHIERYYAKMGLDSPFEDDEKQYLVADDVKEWTERDVEKFLRKTGMISKSAAKALAGRFDIKQVDAENKNDLSKLLEEIKGFKSDLVKEHK